MLGGRNPRQPPSTYYSTPSFGSSLAAPLKKWERRPLEVDVRTNWPTVGARRHKFLLQKSIQDKNITTLNGGKGVEET